LNSSLGLVGRGQRVARIVRYITLAKLLVHFGRQVAFPFIMGQKKQINARVPDNLHGLILERAKLIEETQGGYLGLIAQWWFAQGHPPVNDYEARLLSQKKPREAAAK
jgi:hypothetical protein